MRMLLTGALGNIGLSTLEALLVEGHDVVAFDLESRARRKLAAGFDGRARFVWGDITRPESLQSSLPGVSGSMRISTALHRAGGVFALRCAH